MTRRAIAAIALLSLIACAAEPRMHTLTCRIDDRTTFERTTENYWHFSGGVWRTWGGDSYRPSFHESCYTTREAIK